LNLSKNLILSLDDLKYVLSHNLQLQDLDLSQNPITKQFKYRDQVIMMSNSSLTTLDTVEVNSTQRAFIHNLEIHKKKSQKNQDRKQSSQDEDAFLTVSKASRFSGPRTLAK
jgi:hypothetical protein